MRVRNTMIAIGAAVLLAGGTAIAQPMIHGGGMEMAGGPGGDQEGMILDRLIPLFQRLGLTDDQRTEIRSIADDARSQIESLRASHESEGLREQFKELFSSSTLTVYEVESLLNTRVDAMKEANSIIAEALVDIHDVLTPEQLAMIAEFEPPAEGIGPGMRNAMPRGNATVPGGQGMHPLR